MTDNNKKICKICLSEYSRNKKYSDKQWEKSRFCSNKCSQTNHGLTYTRLYGVWTNIKTRCMNSNNENYPRYGERGIYICDEWKNDAKAFIDYMLPDPGSKYQIDRIDNNKGYEPGNVHWVTSKRNNRNRNNNKLVTFNGKEIVFIDLCEQKEVEYAYAIRRLKRGWTIDEILTIPKGKRRPHKNKE